MDSEQGVRVAAGTLHHAGSLVSSEPRELGAADCVAEIDGFVHALHGDVWHRIDPPLRKYVVRCELQVEAVDRHTAELIAIDRMGVGPHIDARTAGRGLVRFARTEWVEKVKRFPCHG